MADLREQLEAALGTHYRIESELGGGGMSRVYLANEIALNRQVVIKVLPPEMAAGVNQDRFRRETQLAARLQHPHIVPLLSAGAAGDLLYYVMPFIKGESLRAKLAREGELPVGEAVRILREVTDALAYAHTEGVVHRDIKPDNVMISGGHALVTDFGVAKAISTVEGDHSLTSMGIAVGTPTYMAPEQAAGDPHVDHRADLYALGVMAFEMLVGRPPFTGGNAQALLAAHISQAPENIHQLRPAVPPALSFVIMRCLEKRAADRWQSAEELLPQLDMMLTPSGATASAMAAYASSGTGAALTQPHPLRVFVTYLLASIGVLGAVWLVVRLMGLPTWVFLSALGLVALGLPVVLLTARPWQRVVRGGAIAFAALGVITIAYMSMRLLGIGAVGTLMAKGTLAERDRIVLAEFDNRTPDSSLGTTITELLRTDLAQSRSVSVYDVGQLAEVIGRMGLPRTTRVNVDVAKEVATRAGLKAVLAGDITSLGGAYVLSARLLATNSGDVLWAGRENVSGADKLSAAVDRLSAALRAKVGESLRSIRADPALEDMTTTSVEALRLFAQSDRASNAGDRDGAQSLLERAIAQDSNFASAHRRLGVMLRNKSVADSVHFKAEFKKAYDLRERLTLRERYLAEAGYFTYVVVDTAKAVSAYRAVLDRYPDDRVALNNLALFYRVQGKNPEALALYKSAARLKVATAVTFTNAMGLVTELEGTDSAGSWIDAFIAAYPDNPFAVDAKGTYLLAKEQYDSAKVLFEHQRAATRGNIQVQAEVLNALASINVAQGHFAGAMPVYDELVRLQMQAAPPPASSGYTAAEVIAASPVELRANIALGFLRDTAGAIALMNQSLERLPMERRVRSSPDSYLSFAGFYAQARRPDLAEAYWHKWEAAVKPDERANPTGGALVTRAQIAVAEKRPDDALRDYRKARDAVPLCSRCYIAQIGEVFESAGRTDSAIVYYDNNINGPQLGLRASPDQYERFAKLYEARGDKANALKYYQKAADLWKDGDPAIQPRVKLLRDKIASLGGRSAK